ncbi:MAG: S24/S26 family peptidase [Clostridia bacterium]|nr:S24/S26 family peptidase [Clostridia bacterium]
MENMNKKKISLDEIYPIIKEKIENGGTVQLPITGTSMLPLFVWGRDTVELTKCENPQKYDIIFYRRDDGHFVLHRIVGKDENGFILCGDNQVNKEYGITEKHIIAVVKSITRKGKTFSVDKFSYKLYVKLWTLILPFRNIILVPLRKIKGLLK